MDRYGQNVDDFSVSTISTSGWHHVGELSNWPRHGCALRKHKYCFGEKKKVLWWVGCSKWSWVMKIRLAAWVCPLLVFLLLPALLFSGCFQVPLSLVFSSQEWYWGPTGRETLVVRVPGACWVLLAVLGSGSPTAELPLLILQGFGLIHEIDVKSTARFNEGLLLYLPFVFRFLEQSLSLPQPGILVWGIGSLCNSFWTNLDKWLHGYPSSSCFSAVALGFLLSSAYDLMGTCRNGKSWTSSAVFKLWVKLASGLQICLGTGRQQAGQTKGMFELCFLKKSHEVFQMRGAKSFSGWLCRELSWKSFCWGK